MAAEEPKKEKKPRPPPPAPPAPLATAAFLIRGAAAKVFGIRPGPCGGDMQPIWVTEPGTAKVTISLEDTKRSMKNEDAFEALLKAVEVETNALVKADSPVSLFSLDKATAEKRYKDAMYDSKSTKGDELRLGYLPGACLIDLPQGWSLCSTTGACGQITFEFGEADPSKKKKPDTMIMGKKKQLFIKFKVAKPEAPGVLETAGAQPSEGDVSQLDSAVASVQVPGVDTEIAPAAAGPPEKQPEQPAPEKAEAEAKAVALEAVAETLKAAGLDEEAELMLKSAGEQRKIAAAEEEMVCTAWEVKGNIDYSRLVRDFGTKLLQPEGDNSLMERFKKHTVGSGRVPHLHRFLRRDMFFSHRDLDQIFNCLDKGQPFYLYTGRGPSSGSMHLGHLIPFMMTQWLQEAFDVPLVIQMTDDEKFLWKGEYNYETGEDNLMHYRHLTTENAKDIIACGFLKSKTFIFSDLDYVGHMYPNIVRVQKAITYNTARSMFGFQGDNNIGQSAFPAIQAAPSFPSSFPVPLKGQNSMCCLIPCAIDQDPYFRATRDVAHKLVPNTHPLKGKPALVHAKFFPPLQGAQGKMSASDTSSAIFLTDTPEMIKDKIMKNAFSGGQTTAKEQREKGADLNVDVSYQWLRFFLEDDDELERIGKEYSSGQGDYWNTGAVKNKLIDVLQKIVAEHQRVREKITDEEVAEWMRVRQLDF